MLDVKSFDTHKVGSAGNSLRDYLNAIQGKYVNFDFKQLLDEVFVIFGIIKVEVSVISRSRRLG